MGFVRFMQSWAGRVLRIGAGALMVWYGLAQMGGSAGVILAVVGVVPIAAGVFHFCLMGPLLGGMLMDHPAGTK